MQEILSLSNLLLLVVVILAIGWFAWTVIRGQPRPGMLLYPVVAFGVIIVLLALASLVFASRQ